MEQTSGGRRLFALYSAGSQSAKLIAECDTKFLLWNRDGMRDAPRVRWAAPPNPCVIAESQSSGSGNQGITCSESGPLSPKGHPGNLRTQSGPRRRPGWSRVGPGACPGAGTGVGPGAGSGANSGAGLEAGPGRTQGRTKTSWTHP